MRGNVNTRRILYWASTAFAGAVLAAIGIADLIRVPEVIDGLVHLGYPAYFATILGVWNLLGVVAIVTPGHLRLKEWAYAGLLFVLTGAAMSHAISGDGIGKVLVPIAVLGLILTSWRLQPDGKTYAIRCAE